MCCWPAYSSSVRGRMRAASGASRPCVPGGPARRDPSYGTAVWAVAAVCQVGQHGRWSETPSAAVQIAQFVTAGANAWEAKR